MEFIDIFLYLHKKITSGHELYYYVNTYHQIEPRHPRYHPFIRMLCEALKEINDADPGYAQKMIDRIGEIMDEDQGHQIISNLSEILVMRQAVEVADVIDQKKYIVSEPQKIKDDKNPELRSRIGGYYFAAEVKAPDILPYAAIRQSGFQVTTHLHDRNLMQGEEIVDPRILKVKDYLVSAEEKFTAYIKTEEYRNDFRFLFIVWDDYVNEVIPALISPQCGMFTDRSLWKKSDFSKIDGVYIVRHQHQFIRSVNGREFLNGLEHAFQMRAPLPVAFIQNPRGRNVPQALIDSFGAIKVEYDNAIMAEYRAVDWVDWRSGIAVAGLDSVPLEYHKRVFDIIKNSSDKYEPRINPDAANFGTLNLDYQVKMCMKENGDVNWDEFFANLKEAADTAVKFQKYVELQEQHYNESLQKAYREELMKQMQLLTHENKVVD